MIHPIHEIVSKLKLLPIELQKEAITKFPPRVIEDLSYCWDYFARPKQLITDDDFRVLLLQCGRGFGKTRTISEYIKQCVYGGEKNIAIVAPTSKDIRDTIVMGDSGILNVFPKKHRPRFVHSTQTIEFHTGARAICYSADEPDRLRGANMSLVVIDEFASMIYAEDVWMQANMIARIGKNPRIVIATTPKPNKILQTIIQDSYNPDKKTRVVFGSTFDNEANLAKSTLTALKEMYEGTRIGRQELYGELLMDVPGALFSAGVFERTRILNPPLMKQIVVAVDPAGSTGKNSDETGIVVAGLGLDNHAYVLADASGKYSPNEWANVINQLWNTWKPTHVVAENNYGGDMVANTIKTINPFIHVKVTRSATGKSKRAEPVSALFERGAAHLAGSFKFLEDQSCAYSPELQSSQHDDRMDAMVFAINDLVFGTQTPQRNFTHLPIG